MLSFDLARAFQGAAVAVSSWTAAGKDFLIRVGAFLASMPGLVQRLLGDGLFAISGSAKGMLRSLILYVLPELAAVEQLKSENAKLRQQVGSGASDAGL